MVPEANVEVVRRVYEALNRRDVTAALEEIDPSFESSDRGDAPEPKFTQGHDGFERRWGEILDLFDEFRIESKAFSDTGDHVVVSVHRVGRGRVIGALIGEGELHAFRLRGGKMIELREYREKAEALEAVGLAE